MNDHGRAAALEANIAALEATARLMREYAIMLLDTALHAQCPCRPGGPGHDDRDCCGAACPCVCCIRTITLAQWEKRRQAREETNHAATGREGKEQTRSTTGTQRSNPKTLNPTMEMK